MAVVSNSNPWTFLGDLAVVTNPNTKLSGGLGFYGLTSIHGPKGMVAALRLAGAGQALWRLLKVEERELRDDDVDVVTLTSPEPLKFQIDGEYVDERSELEITCARDAVRFIAPAGVRRGCRRQGLVSPPRRDARPPHPRAVPAPPRRTALTASFVRHRPLTCGCNPQFTCL